MNGQQRTTSKLMTSVFKCLPAGTSGWEHSPGPNTGAETLPGPVFSPCFALPCATAHLLSYAFLRPCLAGRPVSLQAASCWEHSFFPISGKQGVLLLPTF